MFSFNTKGMWFRLASSCGVVLGLNMLHFWYQVPNMKALLQTLNKLLICTYGLIIGLITAVPKKNWSCLVVWDMMCQRGVCECIYLTFFSQTFLGQSCFSV